MEPSPDLRERARADAAAAGLDLELLEGGIDDLDSLVGSRRFDVVCAHGLLMYLPDPDPRRWPSSPGGWPTAGGSR